VQSSHVKLPTLLIKIIIDIIALLKLDLYLKASRLY
jgi:hypothetical protein